MTDFATTKCLCGFEQGPKFKTVEEYFLSGSRKGQVKCIHTVPTENLRWIPIRGVGKTDFVMLHDEYYSDHREISVYACPKCGTLKMVL